MESKNTQKLTADQDGQLTFENKISNESQKAVKQEFINNSYWDVTKSGPKEDDIDYDSLYAELESG